MNTSSPSNSSECSAATLSQRLYERPMTFAEIATLSEKCNLWNLEKRAEKPRNDRFTFLVPAFQLVVSISRLVE
jgi:hypothetical protein